MNSASPVGLQAFPDPLTDRTAWLDPFDWYQEMRDDAPVRYDPNRQTWDVFRYDDVKRILDDDETFSVNPRLATDFEEPEEPGAGLIFDTMLFQDPPRHDELRAVVDDAFEPRALRELEPEIETLTTELLDDATAADGSTMELVGELAYPLPVIVIAELLGIPTDDRERFKEWSDALVAAASGDEGADAVAERQQETQQEMAMYFLDAIEDRRNDPRNDLLTQIATEDPDDGTQLSREEALGTCILLLIAGNITTTNLIANAVRCFEPRNLFAELDGDDERALSTSIEEVLRYRSPVQAMTRIATEDVTVRGKEIERGDRIIVWLGSANRDERQFDDADTFVPDRTPNNHLGFGHGTHYCLGAPLARMEARVALSALCSRFDGVRLADTELQPTRSSFIYGVESLPIEYELAE